MHARAGTQATTLVQHVLVGRGHAHGVIGHGCLADGGMGKERFAFCIFLNFFFSPFIYILGECPCVATETYKTTINYVANREVLHIPVFSICISAMLPVKQGSERKPVFCISALCSVLT